jgi:undecaprenyl-phosphate 4-deoxy-4-formamido-L-arabinose transferase
MNIPEISIVIPVYNSGNILIPLHEQIRDALKNKLTYEIIFVNDGSRDDSWKKITELALSSENITGINLRKNSGQDNALMAGLRIARGNYTVIMDDDLQHDPADINSLYEACKLGSDVCFANFRKKNQSYIKNTGSNINGRVAELLIQKPGEIYLSPYKIVNRATVNEIIKFTGPFPYIDGIILSITSNISQIFLNHQPRHSGKSNYTFSRSLSVFMKMFTGFSVLPLRIATITGCIATLVGFVLLIKYLYDYFISKDYIEGWTTVVVLIILFSGLILITLGIVGEYIGRMYLSVNNKPQYSISEIVKSKENA